MNTLTVEETSVQIFKKEYNLNISEKKTQLLEKFIKDLLLIEDCIKENPPCMKNEDSKIFVGEVLNALLVILPKEIGSVRFLGISIERNRKGRELIIQDLRELISD